MWWDKLDSKQRLKRLSILRRKSAKVGYLEQAAKRCQPLVPAVEGRRLAGYPYDTPIVYAGNASLRGRRRGRERRRTGRY